jgi:hypothetical protein
MKARVGDGWRWRSVADTIVDDNTVDMTEIESNSQYELTNLFIERIIETETKPLSLFVDITNSPKPLSSFSLQSNAKFCEIYLTTPLQEKEAEGNYFSTCKGTKETPTSGYDCSFDPKESGSGPIGVGLVYGLHFKCLSLQKNKNEFHLQRLRILFSPPSASTSPGGGGAGAASALFATSGVTASQFPMTPTPGQGNQGEGPEIGINFSFYRSILLSDLSRLLDEKLKPINTQLKRLDQRVEQLQHTTSLLSSLVLQKTNDSERDSGHKRESRQSGGGGEEAMERQSIPPVSQSCERQERDLHSLGERAAVEKGAEETAAVVVEAVSSGGSEDEESLKLEMKHLLRALRATTHESSADRKAADDNTLEG